MSEESVRILERTVIRMAPERRGSWTGSAGWRESNLVTVVIGVLMLSATAGRWWHLLGAVLTVVAAVASLDGVRRFEAGRGMRRVPLVGWLAVVAVVADLVARQVAELSLVRRLDPDGAVLAMVGLWLGVVAVGVALSALRSLGRAGSDHSAVA